MSLGDRVVVLHDGRIEQVAPPEELYARPATTFVAGFVGTPGMNLLPARRTVNGVEPADDGDLTLGVRPVAFVPDATDGLVAELDPSTREFLGAETLVRGRVGTHDVLVRLTGRVPTRAAAPPDRWHVFDAQGRRVER
jgi:sn-glycerol 3-phosphate transport system ATP-binding protein